MAGSSSSKIIAVIGCAPCWADDMAELFRLCEVAEVWVLNRLGSDFPGRFDKWVTVHPEVFLEASEARKNTGSEHHFIAPKRWPGVDEVQRVGTVEAWGGSAGYAIRVANAKGYAVVLCGCPLDESGYYDNPGARGHSTALWDAFKQGHAVRNPDMVRSMSGNTRELCGYPDEEWLNVHGS